MKGRRKSRNAVLGLDMGRYAIKAVEIIRNGSVMTVGNCSFVEVDPATYVDSLKSVLKAGNYRADSVAIAVSGRGVVAETAVVPADRGEDLDRAVLEAAAKLLPYDIYEAIVGYHVDANSHDRNLSVVFGAARRSDVVNRIELAKAAGLEPDQVDVELVALANAVETAGETSGMFPLGTPVCVTDFGAAKTLIVITDGVNRLFHEFPFGGDKLTEMLAHRLDCLFDEAEEVKVFPDEHMDLVKDAIYPGIEDMTAEIRSCIERYSARFGQEPMAIFMSGGLTEFPGVVRLMGRLTQKDTRSFNPFEGFDTGGLDPEFIRLNAHRFSVAFGLACHAGE